MLLSLLRMLKRLINAQYLSPEEGRHALELLLYYYADNVRELPESNEVDDLLASAKSQLPPQTGEVLMTLREHFQKEGMQQGMQQGIEKRTIQIAHSMLRKGYGINAVAEITSLSIQEIEVLRSSSTTQDTDMN